MQQPREYRIGGIFCGEKFSRISCFRKNYTQKTKIYMVHTLFLTDSRNFNPTKYTTYTVYNNTLAATYTAEGCGSTACSSTLPETMILASHLHLHHKKTILLLELAQFKISVCYVHKHFQLSIYGIFDLIKKLFGFKIW